MIGIEGLVKRYGERQVLRELSLEVSRGEVAVLIGASGGGKTTLLKCLNGLESFDGGTIRVDELVLEAGRPRHAARLHHQLRRRVGMVFQHFNLFPHMSVIENVMSGPVHAFGVPREQAAARAHALLERVGLAGKVDDRPATLSGGQQQRVAIARALANEPEVMLFDEPTSALDPRMTLEVLAVMADLASSGQTMLVASHAMSFVRRSAHTVHVMVDGRIVESGPPAQVFEAPRHPGTREFLAGVAA